MMQQYQGQTTPFWENQLKNGLPFFNQLTDYGKGTTAQSFAPAWGQLNRNMQGYGSTLPSGMREQAQTNLSADEGQAFDQNMTQNLMANQQAKESAAASLNPFQPAQIASGTAGSVLSAPPVNPGGVGNFLGGAVSGLMNSTMNAAGNAGGFGALFGI